MLKSRFEGVEAKKKKWISLHKIDSTTYIWPLNNRFTGKFTYFGKISKIREPSFRSIVKSNKIMLLTQNPKFPMNMNLMDISQKILPRKNYFPRILCFSPAMSHIHTPTKMGFPGNRPKMPQLLKNTTSSKIVVWGCYMTHFDRRDLLNSKK